MKTICRLSDAVGGTATETLGGFEKFPVYMGCVTHPEDDDLYSDMIWDISTTNGLIQLKNLIPLEIL